jgi:hypothetical protein
MIPKSPQRIVIAIVIASLLLILWPASRTEACGPFFSSAIFVYSKHPDFPLERFARGQLGVLETSYARSYLVVAYRNLMNEKFSNDEVAGLKGLWEERLGITYTSEDDGVAQWKEARAKVAGPSPNLEISPYRNREKPHEYETFLNCQADAFANAQATLTERIKRFGADSPNVREWLKAQDVVFGNCGDGANIPDPAPADTDALIRSDRAYQIAAANFYATRFDEAAKQFDAIARDSASPWHDMSGYLAARAMLRKGSLAEKEEDGRPALADAETRLQAIVQDKSLQRSHHAATRLLNLTRVRLRPEEKLHELSAAILKKGNNRDFKQTVWDYTRLLDKFAGEGEDVKFESIPASVREDDLTDWIISFQSDADVATSHSIDRWQKTKTLPWLVAALSKANASDTNTASLMEAAARVEHSSSAFPSLVFHMVRLLIESNRVAEARTLLDRTLANDRQNLTTSAVNQLLGQRMMLAQGLQDFLRDAQREPAGFSVNEDGREIPEDDKAAAETAQGAKVFFDWDAANIFNKAMPVTVFALAARSQTLAPNLRRDVAQAAFMRAALLDDRATANQAGTTVSTIIPEMKEFVSVYQQATTPDARRFAAAYLALKFPGLRPYVTVGLNRTTTISEIDSYRDNWWCAESAGYAVDDSGNPSTNKAVTPPQFLRNAQANVAREVAALTALGTAPNYLCQMAINWGTKNPNDPRVPEALHLAVKSTRYGCTDKSTGRWSKAAFDLLHRRYPNSSWAKETKYWFNG